MDLSGVRVGDVVECEVRGARFYAEVESKTALAGGSELGIRPIEKWATYRTVRAGQVVAHFRRSRQGAARARRRADEPVPA